ncbi:lipase [Aetokthonos hydrillicola Thurmond2011]|jgi:predicted lipase|uniref:Lipase n=1 Tax=Aetokthonos hydrillicola Thurmond2011 TaxID=2712845 RepID=A0AAP5MAQ0_9CYAN|nr:lipase [Aetokthonos hydrillicola]MBO3459153.1 lipase [Aetokthonos hydrillicola CCALA 1050]MBW4584112.1 lipase [Aetokthonos hydrillicola CCALA 1050]MDR9898355.1 lipase [Aetokthonos hydrillicola Thurmond2011]
MRLGRRQILLAGLAFGVAVTGTRNLQQLQKKRKLEALAREQSQKNLPRLLKETFEADAKKINQTIKIQESLKLTPPKIPYNRSISKLLIQCSKLGTQQYLAGKVNPSFNGSIKSLPAYTPQLKGYTQIASFKGLEDARISESIQVDVPQTNTQQPPTEDPVENNVDDASKAIDDTVQQTVKLKKLIPVYFGFVLTSKTSNIIVFRGTQRTNEWIGNIWLFQKEYKGLKNSKIHSGFADIYDKTLAEQTRTVASQLNPSVPCYISGHSLGAALATLAAIDLAQNFPKLKQQIRLYTYGGPRVGNPDFAKVHSRLVPNSYRIINLADSIPLSPPTVFRKDIYVHVGQTWSFLKYYGDVLPNHAVDTYRGAINSEAETSK